MDTQNLKDLASNEARGWERMQALRAEFKPELFDSLDHSLRTESAIDKGIYVVDCALEKCRSLGLDVKNIEPGHGVGHLVRDYVNALSFLPDMQVSSGNIFVGLVAGTLHDTGCALIDRYSESGRALRHAEVGSLLFHDAMKDCRDLSDAERIAIAWSIAAHTNYLNPQEVQCADGITRRVEPYQDCDKDGKPLFGIQFARWADRMDCNGPTFPARHYLTLVKSHKDMSGGQFVDMEFAEQMKPIIRSPDEIKAAGGKRTMLEHLALYATSQTNESPYGKYDSGRYAELRDEARGRLYAIIDSYKVSPNLSEGAQKIILDMWDKCLIHNIEPSRNTPAAAMALRDKFQALDDKTRATWCHIFRVTLGHYDAWASQRINAMDKMPKHRYSLPGISQDIRKQISPAY
ncbi:MAG: hypothetical protein MUF61_02875 [archaeon]|nr:hypothetical protein [archaeon]